LGRIEGLVVEMTETIEQTRKRFVPRTRGGPLVVLGAVFFSFGMFESVLGLTLG